MKVTVNGLDVIPLELRDLGADRFMLIFKTNIWLDEVRGDRPMEVIVDGNVYDMRLTRVEQDMINIDTFFVALEGRKVERVRSTVPTLEDELGA